MLVTIFYLLINIVQAVNADFSKVNEAVSKQDVVLSTHTFTGKFVCFRVGDYYHAEFLSKEKKSSSFFLPDNPGIMYYLATKKGVVVDVIYEIVDTEIPEAGGRMTIEQIVDVRCGKEKASVWWSKQKTLNSLQELEKKYSGLVDSAMVE